MKQLKLFKKKMKPNDGCWNCKHNCQYDLDDCLDAVFPNSVRQGFGGYYYNEWEPIKEKTT